MLLITLGVLLLLFALARVLLSIVVIEGASMSPTLERGYRLLSMRKLHASQLQRGQIVVGRFDRVPSSPELFTLVEQMIARGDALVEPEDEPMPSRDDSAELETLSAVPDGQGDTIASFVKRIVGLPGDTVTVALGSLNTGLQTLLGPLADEAGNLTWHVPPAHCFVRGDGTVSTDSLMWGPIPQEAITDIAFWQMPISAEMPTQPIDPLHHLQPD